MTEEHEGFVKEGGKTQQKYFVFNETFIGEEIVLVKVFRGKSVIREKRDRNTQGGGVVEGETLIQRSG